MLVFSIGIIYSQNQIKLPSPINSTNFKTISPYVSYDGNKLIYIQKTKNSDILVESTRNVDGTWSNPISVDVVNVFDSIKYFIQSPVYSQDGNEIFFSLKYDKKDANFDIYSVKRLNGKWADPEKISKIINSSKNETDPFLSPDGKFFYFARNYENNDFKKFDCYKIFVSEKKEGEWQKPVSLPFPVNSGCDRTPRIAADNKTLFFTSVRDDANLGYDIYFAKKITKNSWISPIPIDTISNMADESFPSIPLSGEKIYFQKGSGKGKKRTESMFEFNIPTQYQPEKTVHFYGIISDLNDNSPLSATIDIVDPNTSIVLFSVVTDEISGEYSFFLQKGKQYRIDVFREGFSHYFFNYRTKRLKKFTEVKKDIQLYPEVNLVLNVYDNEIYEPLSAEILVFDFETKKRKNIKVKKTNKGSFNIILPLGKKYIIEAEKSHYEDNKFELDLRGVVQFSEFERDLELQIKKIDYEISLSDSETGEGVEATVEITNLSTNEKIFKTVKTDKNGKIKIKLRDGTRYEISVTPKGYAFYNTTVDLVDENAEHSIDVKLDALKKATKIALNDINFEFNSADLNKSSFDELKMLIKLLQTNPQIKIELSAHTDDVGSAAYNLKLSEKRAMSVKEYLFNNDINPEQVVSMGYGESKPAFYPVETEENRAKNRRVELEIIEVIEE